MDVFDDIVAFHAKFGLVPEAKGLMNAELFDFRLKFINEEKEEMTEAYCEKDLVKFLDACIDIMYVAAGTMVTAGFSAEEMREAWRRVHSANIMKVRATRELDSLRRSTFDVIKPEGWVKPDLDDLCK